MCKHAASDFHMNLGIEKCSVSVCFVSLSLFGSMGEPVGRGGRSPTPYVRTRYIPLVPLAKTDLPRAGLTRGLIARINSLQFYEILPGVGILGEKDSLDPLVEVVSQPHTSGRSSNRKIN